MPTHKKDKKHKKAHHVRRNAAANAVVLPRAIARSRRQSLSEQLDTAKEKLRDDSRGSRLINGVGGAALTGALGLLLEHQTAIPVPLVTVGLAGGGLALALFSPNRTVRSLGVGAAAAGTTLLAGLADRTWFPREAKPEEHPHVASSAGTAKPLAPGKKQSNASDIPADALARAYERARLRMALASEPAN
jgi:hypothetical protein